ncbi:histidine kinase [Erythrobacter sp. QSSC1-22B]|uniref:HWE histidine kinase domain-containing protein n=1 Tax=Erythrobacter sp. QSSC1-22B TaxID=1860125 RepID=UPI000805D347|nr:HWE histidine kinase domain-containing protein [Erythrobacter sp. QSSC1-22B]OBX19428.1 histidine kinase [Erythrobacter sp. QSSC1-22B]
MTIPPQPVDLTNCDREPIHRLGMIQDFGALLALTGDWMVAHRSANFAEMLALDAPPEPGDPVGTLFSTEAIALLSKAASLLDGSDDVERIFNIDLVGNEQCFDCALHASGGLTIIEIEPHEDDHIDRQLRLVQPVMRELEKAADVAALCQIAAEQLRGLLEFDRVMVYRFRSDESGEVVAESLAEGTESFLGLNYPRTDIPQQARELYIRNRFRIISDVHSKSVPIEPGVGDDGAPIDLSMSTLRSVSPVHIEYLTNMGVDASLSISIVVGGKLWGLFACHHYSRRVLPYTLRTGAELFSELFSLAVERSLGRHQTELVVLGRELHDRLMRAVVGGQSLLDALPTLRPIIQRSLPHNGISAYIEGVYQAIGSAPTEDEFHALRPQLNAAASSTVVASQRLTERFDKAQAFADRAVGALIIPVSRSPRDYVVLWRKELNQTVHWAGNAEKPVETGPDGDRLSPRRSFASWKQTVRGRSTAWTEGELRLAENLRVTLIEVILRLTDEVAAERAKAQQQQELLIAELNHRVRNILNLIRGLINQSRHDAVSIDEFAGLVGGRINALATAHDNITRQNWSPASLRELIETEAEAYVSGKMDRVRISGDDALVAPEAYTVLALVIHEMMTNSAKYGSLCDRSGTLAIEVDCDDSGMTLCWKERGGPPVKPPERRGFGSTIIEKSIPFELNGRARLDYRLGGVEAEFWVPGRFVTCTEVGEERSRGQAKSTKRLDQGADTLAAAIGSMLLVEDSMIIALDTEESLRELGVETVMVQSSVGAALEALDRTSFDLALLDYNLGTESSEAVAERLKEMGIPFWLATGYGEMADKREEMGASGLLVKPYGREELAQILTEFEAQG